MSAATIAASLRSMEDEFPSQNAGSNDYLQSYSTMQWLSTLSDSGGRFELEQILAFLDAVPGDQDADRVGFCHHRLHGSWAMDRVEAGFFVTAVTSTIVLVAAISWLAVLS